MQSIHHVSRESRFVNVRGFLLWALLLLLGTGLAPNSAQAQVLTQAQRQAYLNYYAPVILQRAEEDSGKPGRDWISNYDFDHDGNFSNNRYTWANLLSSYVAAGAAGSGAYQNWRIRPTLYSSLVEYQDGTRKGPLLLYHVFHPVDKMASEIHDWERIEIVVRAVTGTPGGTGEYVGHVTVTSHGDHVMRKNGSSDTAARMPTSCISCRTPTARSAQALRRMARPTSTSPTMTTRTCTTSGCRRPLRRR